MLIEEPLASWMLLIGRTLLASVFLVSGIHKAVRYELAVSEFERDQVPLIPVTLPGTILLHLIASICIIVGYQTGIAALLLAVFTVVATLKVHAFWRLPEDQRLPRSRIANANMCIVGGLLILMAAGPGAIALAP